MATQTPPSPRAVPATWPAASPSASRWRVYRFWRDFENLPRFMAHLESVRVTGERVALGAKGPAGTTVEWDAEMSRTGRTSASPGDRSSARRANSGSVRFTPAPGGRGTEVHVEMNYEPPGGVLGRAASRSSSARSPASRSPSDLRRFKQVMETGEVIQSDASIHGACTAAQPADAASPDARPCRPSR